MPQLSIIITDHGDSAALETTLVSVLEHRPADCEVIVSHAGTYDDPYSLGDEVRFVESAAGSPVEVCTVAAIAVASGDVVHLLTPGAEVDEGWCDPVMRLFAERRVAMVCPIIVSPQEAGRVQCVGVELTAGGRRRIVGRGAPATAESLAQTKITGPTSVAGFYRRSAIDQIGGWPTSVGELADIDVASSLCRADYRAAVAPLSVVAFKAKVKQRNSSFRRGLQAERIYWRQTEGRARWLRMPAHLISAGVETFSSSPLAWLPLVAGRAIAFAQGPFAKPARSVRSTDQTLLIPTEASGSQRGRAA